MKILTKFKDFTKSKLFKVECATASGFALVPLVGSALSASAADTGSSVKGALVTGFTSAKSDMLDSIEAILPIALSVLAAVLVIGIGIKIFSKITKRG